MFDVPPTERALQQFGVDVPDWVLAAGGAARAEGGSGAVGPSDIERRNTPADSLDSATAGKGDSPLFADAKSGTVPPPPSASPPSAWQIGLIVGPSGSGKSTIARRMFGARLYRPRQWPDDRAVIDGFGARPIKEITRLLTAVGFSSPPSWIKPYRVLSGGEQFRCDLARALSGRRCRTGCQPVLRNPVPKKHTGQVNNLSYNRRLRRVHFGCRSERRAGRLGGDREGHPRGLDRPPLRRRHLPLRRHRVARAGLGDRHGRGPIFPEASSATADRA